MIITAKKTNNITICLGNMTKIAERTGIPKTTLWRKKREWEKGKGDSLYVRNGWIINFNTQRL